MITKTVKEELRLAAAGVEVVALRIDGRPAGVQIRKPNGDSVGLNYSERDLDEFMDSIRQAKQFMFAAAMDR